MSSISVVVLSHNRRADVLKNLEALCRRDEARKYEIVVVDNASSDGTAEALSPFQKVHRNVRVIANDENVGVARGRNIGIQATSGDIVVCLDDDALLISDLVPTLDHLFARYPRTGIIAFRVKNSSSQKDENPHGDHEIPVANFHGAGHAFVREVFSSAGYLDDQCVFGGEELDMSIRAHAVGFGTTYTPQVVVDHNSLARSGQVGAERLERWLYNYTRVLYKHFPSSMAGSYAHRYLVSYLVTGSRRFGPRFALQLPNAFRNGRA